MLPRIVSLIILLLCFIWRLSLQAQTGSMSLQKNAHYEMLPAGNKGFLVAEITHLDHVQRSQGNFILYDSLCRDISNVIIPLPWPAVFNGSIVAGSSTIVSFFSQVNNKTMFLTIDQTGKQVHSKEIDVAKSMQIPWLSPLQSTDGFFITSRTGKKKRDITITKLDFQYNELWKKEFRAEKDLVTFDKLEKIGDKIFVFHQKNVGSKKYEASLVVLDEKSGNTLFGKSLTDGGVIKTPTALGMDGDNILVAGLYVMGKYVKDSYCDGFFLGSYTPDGKVNFETFNAWKHEVKEIYTKSGVDCSRLQTYGSEKAILQYIKKTDKGYTIIAETFKQVPNGADAAAIIGAGIMASTIGVAPFINPKLSTYKILDMLLYELDGSGQLQYVHKIEKPEVLRSIPVDLGELKVVNTIQDYGVFDYKFSVATGQANEEYIFFREYMKKESCKVNMIRLSDVQRSQVRSYSLLLHVPNFRDIRYFNFLNRNNGSVLMYYQTKHSLDFKILHPKEFY